MGYELRAIIGRAVPVEHFARGVDAVVVDLQGDLLLVPVTDEVFDRLGGGHEKPFGDAFWFLSAGIDALARQASEAGPLAYVEVEFFGGVGGQSAVVWSSGGAVLGPLVEKPRVEARGERSGP